MKKAFTLLLFSGFAMTGFAQQATQYSLYMLNPAQFNPAFAGMEGTLSFNGVFRKQWVNLDGSPSQQSVTAHLPLFFLNSGVGIAVENDVLGARRYTSGTIQYNYQLQVGSQGLLSAGVGAGIAQVSLDGSKLRTPDGSYVDNMFDHQDNLLFTTEESAVAPVIHGGVFYQTDRMGLGFSVLNLYEPSFQFEKGNLSLSRSYALFGKYEFDISRLFSLQPSVLLKSESTQYQAELSGILTYDGRIFAGCTYRGFNKTSQDALIFLAGWKISNQTTLSYGYDYPLSSLSAVNNGSHEVLISYQLEKTLGKGKFPKIIYNPRFL